MAGEARLGDEKFTLSGTDYHFMLPSNGQGALGFSSASPFSPKSSYGERTYADYDVLSAFAFTDMSGGMGQDRATDATRYNNAINCDVRGGRIVLGPLVTATALKNMSAYQSQYFQEWSSENPTGTTVRFVTVTTGVTKYVSRITTAADVTHLDRIWLPLAEPLAGVTYTVKIYADTEGAPGSQVTNASTTLDVKLIRQAGNWTPAIFSTQVTVVGATNYWVSVEVGTGGSIKWYGASGAQAADAYVKHWDGDSWEADAGYSLPVWYDDPTVRPDSPPTFVIGAGEDSIMRVWAFAGKYIYYVNTAGVLVPIVTTGTTLYRAAADIMDLCWFQGTSDAHSWLYVALGDSTIAKRFDANIGTEGWEDITSGSPAVDIQARQWCVHDKILWRSDERCQISGSLDGKVFGTMEVAGDRTYTARNMISWNGDVYIGKDDGLYKCTYETGYPTSGTPTITKILDFTAQADINNFHVMVEHQGDLYFSIAYGLMKYTTGGVVIVITPDTGLNLAASQRSQYKGAVSSLNVLWVTAEGSLDGPSSILSYIDNHWHPIVTPDRSGEMMRSIAVEPGLYGTTPRLWFGQGINVGYVKMPTTTQRRWLWDDMDWAADGYVDLSWVDGGIRTVEKDWIEVTVDCRDVGYSAGSNFPYVELWWRKDEATAWSQIDTDVIATGISSKSFTTSTYSSKAQLRVKLFRGSMDGTTTTTPQVEAIVLRYMERPDDLRAFTRTYEFSDGMNWRSGQECKMTLAQWVTQLETLRESKEPLTWTTWWGGSYTVHIVDYSCSERIERTNEIKDRGTIMATVRLQAI